MTSAQLPVSTRAPAQIRPINLTRDVPQVMRLLNQVFSPTLDSEGRQALNSMGSTATTLHKLTQLRTRVNAGFVWEEDGQILGNVSLIQTKIAGRVIIANVAVAEAQRRRGIARRLMEAALNHLAERGTHMVVLQVDVDNETAARLYRSLGFVNVGSTTLWYAGASQWHEIATNGHHNDVRPLRTSEATAAYELDRSSYPPDLVWPEPTGSAQYHQGWWQWFDNLLNGRAAESWTVADTDGRLLALGTIWSEWGRPYNLTLRMATGWGDELARPVLAKLLRRLVHMRHRAVTIEHLKDDAPVSDLLAAANFWPRRHLTTMKLQP